MVQRNRGGSSADKAYLSITNLSVLGQGRCSNVHPSHVEQHAANGVDVWQMWHVFWLRGDEFLKNYHRRSNLVSTFSAVRDRSGFLGGPNLMIQ